MLFVWPPQEGEEEKKTNKKKKRGGGGKKGKTGEMLFASELSVTEANAEMSVGFRSCCLPT